MHRVILIFPLYPAAFSQKIKIYGCCCTVVPLSCVWWAIAQVHCGQFVLLVTESAGWLQLYISLPTLVNMAYCLLGGCTGFSRVCIGVKGGLIA